MDGRAARLLGVSGPFGVEMDSMCDLGAFGVAPAILIYQFGMTDLGWLGKFIAGFYTFMGAMRLARFNVNVTAVHGYFQGMPIPAGACVIATYVLSGFNFPTYFTALLTFATGLYYIVMLSFRILKVTEILCSGFRLPLRSSSAWYFYGNVHQAGHLYACLHTS
jgi:phosphatidylserine synthase